jgi:hypothetical protein
MSSHAGVVQIATTRPESAGSSGKRPAEDGARRDLPARLVNPGSERVELFEQRVAHDPASHHVRAEGA